MIDFNKHAEVVIKLKLDLAAKIYDTTRDINTTTLVTESLWRWVTNQDPIYRATSKGE